MSQFPPAYTESLEFEATAPTLESDLNSPDTEPLLEGCPVQPVTRQPQEKQQEDAEKGHPQGYTPWQRDCSWTPTAVRIAPREEQTPLFKFATSHIYFKLILAMTCISICFSVPIGLCALCVALCAYSEFSSKKYNSALALSWVASALGIVSVIVGIVAIVLFYKFYIQAQVQAQYNAYGGGYRYYG